MKTAALVLMSGLFGFNASAAEILPSLAREVKTPGLAKLQISGRPYSKVSSVYELQYEQVKVESAKGQRDTLILDLDESVVSFAIVIYTEKRNFGFVHELVNPLGEGVISPNPKGVSSDLLNRTDIAGRGQLVSPNGMYFEAYQDLSVTPVPNSDRVKIMAGRWKFSIGVEAQTPAQSDSFRVSVFVKKSKKITSEMRGVVHAQVSATVESSVPTQLKDMAMYLDDSPELKSIGLHVVLTKVARLESSYNSMCDREDRPCSAQVTALRKSNSKRMPGVLKVFFAKRNNFANSGIANLAGSVSSLFANENDMFDGVFVWTDPTLPTGFEDARKTFVHELAHQLGLYHTNVDQITDTKSSDHWTEGNQGEAPKNLMSGDGDTGSTVSNAQKAILLKAVAVELYEPTK
ncbi:MAG: zinc-dependent metalloprotease family protein [Bdellovibrionota bacterium]